MKADPIFAQFEQVFRHMRGVYPLSLVPALFILAAAWEYGDQTVLLIWLIAYLFLEILLFGIGEVFLHRSRTLIAIRSYQIFHILICALWSLPLVLFGSGASTEATLLMLLPLYIIASASLSPFSWHWQTYAGGVLLLLLPAALILLLMQHVILMALGAVTLLALPVLFAVARREYQSRKRFIADAEEKRELERSVSDLRKMDPLTGLQNSETWLQALQDELANTRPGRLLTVLHADLRGFRKINQRHGKTAGDLLLRNLAAQLSANFSPRKIAHLAGDEFLIWERVANLAEATKLGRAIEQRVAAPPVEAQFPREMRLEAVVGIAVAEPEDSAAQLMEKAALANHFAKTHRFTHGMAFYDPELANWNSRRLQIEATIDSAIDGDQFNLVYQPKVDLNRRVMVGAEALIRWKHPTLGVISPGEFIPIAEASGRIVRLGNWILEQACSAMASLGSSADQGFHLAVNLSPPQLYQKDLASFISTCLNKNGLQPQSLHVELTETAIVEEPEAVLEEIRAIRSIGVAVALDDFGTGFSSLSHLKELDIDYLKLDQSFIREVLDDRRDPVIVSSVIRMAHELGILTVAEGIESEAIAQALEAMKCDQGQGWHFARPVSLEDLRAELNADQTERRNQAGA